MVKGGRIMSNVSKLFISTIRLQEIIGCVAKFQRKDYYSNRGTKL